MGEQGEGYADLQTRVGKLRWGKRKSYWAGLLLELHGFLGADPICTPFSPPRYMHIVCRAVPGLERLFEGRGEKRGGEISTIPFNPFTLHTAF